MTLVKKYDVIVVGGGVMGAATTFALAKRGVKVLLMERFTIPHSRGSSHGRSRIFRLSYRDARYVEMAFKAGGLWRELEAETNEQLLHVTGGLDLGEGIEENAKALESFGAPFEMLTGREVERKFHSVAFETSFEHALFQPHAGIVQAERAISSFVAAGKARGADIQEGLPAERLEPIAGGIRVHSKGMYLDAGRVVVAAGGWVNKVLEPLDMSIPVRVTRETVAYFGGPQGVPPPVVEWGNPTIYACPSPGQGIKAGEHIAGKETDPDTEGQLDKVSLHRVGEWVRKRFPIVEPMEHSAETCIYTNTADEDFILERRGEVVIGSPCSGHGFKFAPLIGEQLADLALE